MAEDHRDWLLSRNDEFEARCHCCGECCGASDGDPCAHLVRMQDGTFRCADYGRRLGMQITVGGKPFECVPIQNVIRAGGIRPGCGYGHIDSLPYLIPPQS